MDQINAFKTTFRNYNSDCEFYKSVCIDSVCTESVSIGSVYIECL